jgi:hypothetical protein
MVKALNIAHRGYTKDFPGNTLEASNSAYRASNAMSMKLPIQNSSFIMMMISKDAQYRKYR